MAAAHCWGELSVQKQKFVNLPVEIQLSVLAHLPAKQLLTTRLVSKAFKAVIDVNEVSLAIRVMEQRLSKLRKDMHVFDYSDTPMFEALKHWTKAKGMWAVASETYQMGFSTHFIAHRTTYRDRWETYDVLVYVWNLINAHLLVRAGKSIDDSDLYASVVEKLRIISLPHWVGAVQGDSESSDIQRVMGGELQDAEIYGEGREGISTFTHRSVTRDRASSATMSLLQSPEETQVFLNHFGLPAAKEYQNSTVGPKTRSTNTGLDPRVLVSYCINQDDEQEFRCHWAAAKAKEGRSLHGACVIDMLYVW